MAITIKHAKTSNVADSGNTDLVQPSDWNANLVTSMATSRLVGRTTAGSGSFEEIVVGSGLDFSSTTLSLNLEAAYGFTIANSAPSTPTVGHEWLDTTTGILYTYINDGDSSFWVELSAGGDLLSGASEIGVALATAANVEFARETLKIYVVTETEYGALTPDPEAIYYVVADP